jgi:hypothetical protein
MTNDIEQIRKANYGEDDAYDQWTPLIDAVHPMNGGSCEHYTTALEMVGNRHSKYALVELVNWLLIEQAKTQKQLADALKVTTKNTIEHVGKPK